MYRGLVFCLCLVLTVGFGFAQETKKNDKWVPKGARPDDLWSSAMSAPWVIAVARVTDGENKEKTLEMIVPSYTFEKVEGSKWLAILKEDPGVSPVVAEAVPTDEEIKEGKLKSGQKLKEHKWASNTFKEVKTYRVAIPLSALAFNRAVTDVESNAVDMETVAKQLASPKHVFVNFLGWGGSPEKYYASVYREDMLWINAGMGSEYKYRVPTAEKR